MTNSNPKLEEIKYINWINSRICSPNDDEDTESDRLEDQNIFMVDRIGDNLIDGIQLLKLFDGIYPEIIEWKKIDQKANNKFKQIQNCNYLINKMKEKAMPIASQGGRDIVDGDQGKLFAVLWLLMRQEYIKENGMKTEEEIKNWANQFIYNVVSNDIESDELDYQPLRILLYMSEEAETFMNFADDDEEEIECPLIPSNFDMLNLGHESYKDYNLEQLVTYTKFVNSYKETINNFNQIRKTIESKKREYENKQKKALSSRNVKDIVATNSVNEPDKLLFDNYRVESPKDEINGLLSTFIHDNIVTSIDNFNDQMFKNNVYIDQNTENNNTPKKDGTLSFETQKTPKKLLFSDLRKTSWNQIFTDKNAHTSHRQSNYKKNTTNMHNIHDRNSSNRKMDEVDSPFKQIENDIKKLIQLNSQEPNSVKKAQEFNEDQDLIINEDQNIKKKIKQEEVNDETCKTEVFHPIFEKKDNKEIENIGKQLFLIFRL